ncbi:FkbM family methyltransferase [Geminocystis sp.]|uniref:FkbM family methyltransferase n=1 Tax=Geminocystis sp. TaxID=2664100 RepID=UPI0035947D5B
MSSESNSNKGIMSFLANLPLIRRIKIIKELSLEKLDQLIHKSDNLDGKIDSLLNNDTSFLEAIINIIKALKNIYKQSQEQYSSLTKLIQNNYQNLTILLKNSESNHEKIDTLEAKINDLNTHFPVIHQEIGHTKTISHDSLSQQVVIKQLCDDSLSQQIVIKQLCNDSLSQQKFLLEQQKEIKNILTKITSKPLIINESSRELNDPEIGLMMYLYSFLPTRYAIDVGANIGDMSESLLKAGYEVFAFEPFLPVYEKLNTRLGNYPNFHSHQIALGSTNETTQLYLATDKTPENIYQDSTFYSSLIKHSMPEDLPFTDTTTVAVKTLASLHDSREIPADVSLVKIDAEGFDLQVIHGMGLYQYPVVITEFWDDQFPFGISDTHNRLDDLVTEMRRRKYYWYVVMYRVWGDETQTISFYCNHPQSVSNSWGNIFFFHDYNLFVQAHRWTLSVLPETYFR